MDSLTKGQKYKSRFPIVTSFLRQKHCAPVSVGQSTVKVNFIWDNYTLHKCYFPYWQCPGTCARSLPLKAYVYASARNSRPAANLPALIGSQCWRAGDTAQLEPIRYGRIGHDHEWGAWWPLLWLSKGSSDSDGTWPLFTKKRHRLMSIRIPIRI